MRALSEPSLPGQMLFQASRLPQAGLLLPQHRHPTFTPTPGPSPNFSCPCRAGQSQAQPKPLLSLHRPICEQPRPTGAPQGRTLQVQMASTTPPSAWPCVPDGPHPTPVSHQSHLSPAHMHMCTRKNVYQLGCRASTLPHPPFWYILVSSLLLDFGCPPSCHIPSYLVLSPSPSPMWCPFWLELRNRPVWGGKTIIPLFSLNVQPL